MTRHDAAGFAARYRSVVAERGRLCVGIDPHPELLESWGLPVSVDGLRRFADNCVQAFASTAAVIKPQVAFFEAFGASGYIVLEQAIAGCRAGGALVLADAKRGDIGSTMAAYTRAWLGEGSPLLSDAVTVSSYLGFEALRPALDTARAQGRGVFTLARTSNPEGGQLQTATVEPTGVSVAQSVVDAAAAENADGRGTVGLVVGATRDHGLDLSALHGPILAPGFGAQGGTSTDVARIFAAADASWVLPATSRAVLQAGPNPAALTAALSATRDEVEAALA